MITFHYEGLHTVISGAQTGSDQAGLYVAQTFRIKTGGWIPKGFRTLSGSSPELAKFGLIETTSLGYPDRTRRNAQAGDATVRLASNLKTAGEVLTLKYCVAAKKPVFDVLLDRLSYSDKADALVEFLIRHSVSTLNVAGNGDRVDSFHFNEASKVLTLAFSKLSVMNLLVKS